MKKVEVPIGLKIYLYFSAAFSAVYHVFYIEHDFLFQLATWEGGGWKRSLQQFVILACLGLGVYHLVKFLYSPSETDKGKTGS